MDSSLEQCVKHYREMFAHHDFPDGDAIVRAGEILAPFQHQLRPLDKTELLPLYSASGLPCDLVAPRWLCHVLGLRHRCVHLLLIWRNQFRQAMLVLQVRNWEKDDSPGHLDISVGGHMTTACQQNDDFVVYREMEEEIGLSANDLMAPLQHIGSYDHYSEDLHNNYINHEWRDVYLAELQTHAIHQIHFADQEVCGLLLYPLAQVDSLLTQTRIPLASGIKHSLPMCVETLNLMA